MGANKSTGRGVQSAKLATLGDGQFGVGYVDLMTDDGCTNEDIGIFATIYYPIDSSAHNALNNDNSQLWLPRRDYLKGLAAYRKMSSRKVQMMYDWLIGKQKICASRHAHLENSPQKFPLLIFSHGLSACRHFYSILCSSLATNGYIVAVLEHRDHSACWTYKLCVDENGEIRETPVEMYHLKPNEKEFPIRNKQLHRRVAECVKMLHIVEQLNLGKSLTDGDELSCKILLDNDFDWSQFEGRIDMSKIAVIGHSFGGATGIAAASFSTEFSIVIVLDGWLFPIDKESFSSVQQPVLFINSKHFQWVSNVQDMYRIKEFSQSSIIITLRDAVHYSFTDFAILMPRIVARRTGLIGTSNPRECLESVIELITQFLQHHFEANGNIERVLQKYHSSMFHGTDLNISVPES